jgi:hypothetical protein
MMPGSLEAWPASLDDVQLGLGPCPVQGPGAGDRRHDVEPSLGDPARDVADAADVLQQPAFLGEEAAVGEVPAFDAGEGDRELGFGELVRAGVRALRR